MTLQPSARTALDEFFLRFYAARARAVETLRRSQALRVDSLRSLEEARACLDLHPYLRHPDASRADNGLPRG